MSLRESLLSDSDLLINIGLRTNIVEFDETGCGSCGMVFDLTSLERLSYM